MRAARVSVATFEHSTDCKLLRLWTPTIYGRIFVVTGCKLCFRKEPTDMMA
jgi:hypothetical protein